MSGRSWNYRTRMKPGYTCGPDSLSEPCPAENDWGSELVVGVPEFEVISSTLVERKRNLAFRKGLLAAIAKSRARNLPLPPMGQWLTDSLEREAAAKAHRARQQLERVPDADQMLCQICHTTWDVCVMERDPATLFPFCKRCWITSDARRAKAPPEAFCNDCGTTWTIDSMDRDWHVSTP